MGLLKHLLLWPVTGPSYLVNFSLEKLEGVARQELTDDSRVKEELMELQLLLEMGDIDDDEYVRREADLMARLREVREWRERFGMATSGGPVAMGGAEHEEERAPRVVDPSSASVDVELTFDDGGPAR